MASHATLIPDQCALGDRIAAHNDITRVPTPSLYSAEPDGTVETTDPWFIFTYNDRWQKVGGWGTFRAAVSSGTGSSWGGGGITPDASPKEIQIHHRAGASGYGGSSYIDSMLLREKDTRDSGDAIQPPYAAADSTRDQTLYYVQNWRADVVALLNTDGRAVEHVRYTAYGSPRRFLTSSIDIAYDDGDLVPPLGSPKAALRNNGCVPLIRPCGSVLVDRRTSQHTDPQSRISGTKAINATHPCSWLFEITSVLE